MSIDKTLRLTNQSSSQIASFFDNRPAINVSEYCEKEAVNMPKLSSSHSLKSLRNETTRVVDLQYENEMLKAEVAMLKKQIRAERQHQREQTVRLEQEISKLKKLIQKSYYSLKHFQEQNQCLKTQNLCLAKTQQQWHQEMALMEQKSTEMCAYIIRIKSDHEKEASLIWQRVSHLQRNLESVVQIIEQDRVDDKRMMQSLRGSRGEGTEARRNGQPRY